MPSDINRKEIYKQARLTTGVNKRQWSRLMCLGKLEGNVMVVVGKKEKDIGEPNSRGVNFPEALAAQLLAYLHAQGKNIEGIVFDDTGVIVSIPDRK